MVLFITDKVFKVTHYANIIAGEFYNNTCMFESSKTPTRTETVSVNCSVYLPVKRWAKEKSLQILAKYQQWRCVSESHSCRHTVQCALSVICSAVI